MLNALQQIDLPLVDLIYLLNAGRKVGFYTHCMLLIRASRPHTQVAGQTLGDGELSEWVALLLLLLLPRTFC